MKSRSRRVCIIGTAFCLGMLICAAGQAEEPGQNAPPFPPAAKTPPQELPVPPELQNLQQADAPPPPPELPKLTGENAPPPLPVLEQADIPPLPSELQELQQMMEQVPEPPPWPKDAFPPAPEKPAAEATAKDKLDDTKVKKNEAP